MSNILFRINKCTTKIMTSNNSTSWKVKLQIIGQKNRRKSSISNKDSIIINIDWKKHNRLILYCFPSYCVSVCVFVRVLFQTWTKQQLRNIAVKNVYVCEHTKSIKETQMNFSMRRFWTNYIRGVMWIQTKENEGGIK